MKDIRSFEGWRAEEIAKVYLLNTRLVDVLEDSTDKADFIAINKLDSTSRLIVEVKATKYSKNEIKNRFAKTVTNMQKSIIPVLLLYINYDNEKGFYQFIKQNQIGEIKPLNTINFKDDLKLILH